MAAVRDTADDPRPYAHCQETPVTALSPEQTHQMLGHRLPAGVNETAQSRRQDEYNLVRRQRLGMPLSRRIDAFMTCTRESAMRTPPTRLVTATKVASTGDTRTPIVRVDLLRLEGAFEPLHGCDRSFLLVIAAPRAVHSIFTWF